MHDIIYKIQGKIEKYDGIRSEVSENYISVIPDHPDSFTVRLDVSQNEFTMSFSHTSLKRFSPVRCNKYS
jgi:hypothetical protein